MEIITTRAPETYYQECCAECGSPLVTTSRELVCEYCGIVAEDRPFDFHESRANYKWRQNARDKKLSINRRTDSIQSFLRYKILNQKIRRSHQLDIREKLFNSEIARLCGQLELPSVILRDAELYANDILKEIPPYTHFDSILAAATALVWGCTFIYSPRTLQEIMSVVHPEVSRSKVLQAANRLVFTQLIKAAPRMLENKQFTNLVNFFIEHFGAILNVPIDITLTAKALFKHLGYKTYIIKPDTQSVALLWYAWTKKSAAKEYITLNESLDSQKEIPKEIKKKNAVNKIKRRIGSISGYEKGHKLRSQIIELLKDQDLSVKELAKRLQNSYHTVYYHVQKLKESGILSEERKKAKGHRKPQVEFSIKSLRNSGNNHRFKFRVRHAKENNGNGNGHKNSNMPKLKLEMVSERCFTSKTSIRKVVRAIQKDIKKETNSALVN
ncbi:MAG: helix-turn-helix domain-containing protein [Promethearchaeota archaeon]